MFGLAADLIAYIIETVNCYIPMLSPKVSRYDGTSESAHKWSNEDGEDRFHIEKDCLQIQDILFKIREEHHDLIIQKRRALGSAPTVPKSMSPSPPVNCKSSNQAPDQESGSEYGSRIAHEYIPGYRPVTRSQGPAPTYGGGGGSGQNLIDFADDPNVNQYRLAPLPMDDQLAYRPKLSKSPLRSAHHPEDFYVERRRR